MQFAKTGLLWQEVEASEKLIEQSVPSHMSRDGRGENRRIGSCSISNTKRIFVQTLRISAITVTSSQAPTTSRQRYRGLFISRQWLDQATGDVHIRGAPGEILMTALPSDVRCFGWTGRSGSSLFAVSSPGGGGGGGWEVERVEKVARASCDFLGASDKLLLVGEQEFWRNCKVT